MKFGTRKRWAVLIALLTAALSAAAWVREGDRTAKADVVYAPARPASSAGNTPVRAKPADERVHLEKLRMRSTTERAGDAFAPRTWRKPQPEVKAAANAVAANAVIVAPAPSAPPLPFVYMGKMESEDKREVFLTLGERNLIVHEGDEIDATYRVASISNAGLTFIHLPTGIRQNLQIGESQ